jgi:hypothetical protein
MRREIAANDYLDSIDSYLADDLRGIRISADAALSLSAEMLMAAGVVDSHADAIADALDRASAGEVIAAPAWSASRFGEEED